MLKRYSFYIIAVLLGLAISTTHVYATDQIETHQAKINHNKKVGSTAPVNINTADVKTLMTLKHIGEKRAAAIVAYREKNGPFSSAQDLKKIKGITQKMIEINQARIQVS